jgi:putative Holliday junction resolvase
MSDEIMYLGIDWGEKRIGLALGDSVSRLATPFKVVAGLEDVFKVIRDEEIDEIVIGAPISLGTGLAGFSRAYSDFVAELEDKAGIPINRIDERLTSKHADSLSGDKKTKAARDAIAAMIILESFFERMHK